MTIKKVIRISDDLEDTQDWEYVKSKIHEDIEFETIDKSDPLARHAISHYKVRKDIRVPKELLLIMYSTGYIITRYRYDREELLNLINTWIQK